MTRLLGLLLSASLCAAPAWAAEIVVDEASTLPEGIQPALARIEGPQGLSHWAQALQDLSSGARTRVSVCHIGDSHLQAGQMDAVLRRALQQRWGDAGRGFVFPYEETYTSNPPDLAAASDVEWSLRRMMGDDSGGPVGAGGLSAIARSVPFVMGLAQLRGVEPSAGFDRVRVFFEPGPDRSELWVATRGDAGGAELALRKQAWKERLIVKGDTLSGIAEEEKVSVADLRRWNGAKLRIKAGQHLRLRQSASEAASRLAGYTVWGVLKGQDPAGKRGLEVDLGSSVQEVFLLGAQAAPEQTSAELQGVLLERANAKGLVWNTLAANGAQAKHFTRTANFPDQLAAMAPDLIVVSLGTNETQQSDYKQASALAEERRLWDLLRKAAPQASLLVCSPVDAAHSHACPKGRLDGFSAGLRSAALDDGAAFLDLRAAQGGDGAYSRWRAAGLAGKDGVHYRHGGYRLMGQWVLDALDAEAAHAP